MPNIVFHHTRARTVSRDIFAVFYEAVYARIKHAPVEVATNVVVTLAEDLCLGRNYKVQPYVEIRSPNAEGSNSPTVLYEFLADILDALGLDTELVIIDGFMAKAELDDRTRQQRLGDLCDSLHIQPPDYTNNQQ